MQLSKTKLLSLFFRLYRCFTCLIKFKMHNLADSSTVVLVEIIGITSFPDVVWILFQNFVVVVEFFGLTWSLTETLRNKIIRIPWLFYEIHIPANFFL